MTSYKLLLISQSDRNHLEIITLIPENENNDELSKAEILADFRQVWHEAMTGETISLYQLWDFLPS
jgi:hypothetical protein